MRGTAAQRPTVGVAMKHFTLEPASARLHKHNDSTASHLLSNGSTTHRPTGTTSDTHGHTATALLPNGSTQKQAASPIHKNGYTTSSLLNGSMTHKFDNTASGSNGSSVHLPKLSNGTTSRTRHKSDKCSGAAVEDSGVCSMLESLRWDHALSDEEAEKARLEVYRSNRRKRYQTALERQQKPVLVTRLTTKNGRCYASS